MATTYLTRTQGTPTDAKKYTFSTWVKLGRLKTDHDFMFGVRNDANNNNNFYFRSASDFVLTQENVVGGTAVGYFYTNRKFRDVSAWYHIVVAVDTSQVTSSNRVKVYVNGVQETSFSSILYPTLNSNDIINTSGSLVFIGQKGGSYGYLDGLMTHIHFIDGLAYDASTFGETDSLTGIWKPIISPSVTYGNNGFFLKFANSSLMGTDSSGEGNDFTVNGNLTQTQDTPSNVFATMNALENSYSSFTLSNGNLKAVTSNYSFLRSTLGASAGKYYMEVKCTAQTGSSNKWQFGISDSPSTSSTNYIGANSYQYGWRGNADEIFYNGTTANYGSGAMATGYIIGMALDLDNNKIYWSINGTWKNSGDPASNSNGFSITAPASTNTGYYHFAFGELEGTDNFTFETNFGNGYFGTTPVADAGTNASGIGIFEYDVPTGYTALSTKGLNL